MTSPRPVKPSYFSQKVIRLLTKTASALELGPSVCWMLSVIVSQEDAIYYREPAKFYYGQLMPLCGFNSPKQLRAAIQRAIDFGWLCYTPGAKGRPCYFSVCIPEKYAKVEPTGCDESEFTSESEAKTETNVIDSLPNRTSKGERKRKRKGHASIPNPNPIETHARSVFVECPEGVEPSIWQDWLAVRKSKRLCKPTKSVLNLLESEATKAGLTIAQAVAESAQRGWGGFEAAWLKPGQHRNAKQATGSPPIPRVLPETKVGDYEQKPKQRRAPA